MDERRRLLQNNSDFDFDPILYSSTGKVQTFVVPHTGKYLIECWGSGSGGTNPGYGAYVSGEIELTEDTTLYIYVGNINGYNGGGSGNTSWTYTGAGATDVRVDSTLNGRIIVASGGTGGCDYYEKPIPGVGGGGLIGYSAVTYSTAPNSASTTNATQTSAGKVNITHEPGKAGSFGKGGNGSYSGGGGGGGWYGGGGGGAQPSSPYTGSTGTCFISGHEGCNARDESGSHTNRPNHYSGLVFTNTLMIDGHGYRWTSSKQSLQRMPKPNGGYYSSGYGHSGSGYCKISKA